MSPLVQPPVDLDVIVKIYLKARVRSLEAEHEERFNQVRDAFTSAHETGAFRSLTELGECFGVDRETVRRILTGLVKEVGKERIEYLARELGIPHYSKSKLNVLLQVILPQIGTKSVDVDHVEQLVVAIGRLPLYPAQSTEFTDWITSQAERYSQYPKEEVDAAIFWLALRPRLPGYRNLLIRLARTFCTPEEADQFVCNLKVIETLRNSARWAHHRYSKELKSLDPLSASERLINYMWDDLQERCFRSSGNGVVIGLLAKYDLNLIDLLTLTQGELLEKSTWIRNFSSKFLPIPRIDLKGGDI